MSCFSEEMTAHSRRRTLPVDSCRSHSRRTLAWSGTTVMSNATAAPIVVCLKDLEPRTLSWLWPGRIALGKLCLLDGDPGQGKSLFTVDLCARLTRGQPLPDGAAGHPPINVLFLCEDDLSDTVLPRLQQLTGEAGRVFAYQGMQAEQRSAFRSPLFPRDAAVLQRVIEQTDS